ADGVVAGPLLGEDGVGGAHLLGGRQRRTRVVVRHVHHFDRGVGGGTGHHGKHLGQFVGHGAHLRDNRPDTPSYPSIPAVGVGLPERIITVWVPGVDPPRPALPRAAAGR